MLLRSFVSLGLASFSLALPVTENADTSAPGVYVTDTYTDQHGVEKRATKAISTELHERLIYYSEYATAAYCPPQQAKSGGGKVTCQPAKTCGRVEKANTKIYNTWLNFGNNSATGFVAADHDKKMIIIAMRGSVSINNWIADLKFGQTACPKYGGPGAYCNIGFLGFWEQSEDFAMKGLAMGLKENPDYNIALTGHSLGAAAAVFGASKLRQNPTYKNKKVELYSYGQPRAGDKPLTEFVTKQGNNYRVTHTSDIVPKLPPEYSPLSGLTGNYYHISPEYWISDGVGMKINNIKVVQGISSSDGNAGTGFMKFNIVAHVQYFQNNMYYCVLPLPDLGVGYADGTKRIVDEIDSTVTGTMEEMWGPSAFGTSSAEPWVTRPTRIEDKLLIPAPS